MPRKKKNDLTEVHVSASEITIVTPDGDVIDAEVLDDAELTAKEKQRRAVILKLAGHTYETIAQQAGYGSAAAARNAIKAALERDHSYQVAELKAQMHARLEHMMTLLWPDVNQKKLPEMHMALAIMDRLERLHGLNTAQVLEIGPVNNGPKGILTIGGAKDELIEGLKRASQAHGQQDG